MKRLLMSAIAASALTAAAVPAFAQAWMPINQRQAMLEQRINQGIRAGTLTPTEAVILRGEFRGIANLEARYRATNGLSAGERADLDRRLNGLQMRIAINKTDIDYVRNWRTINQRQATFVTRIQTGVRNGALTQAEANQLRAEFNGLAAMEATYRRSGGGLTLAERRDLDRRMDALSRRIFINKHDRQVRH
ncbi:MAG TPA: hypothetical protein VF559_06750 [Caulobacteraceae bacterium]|jgi:hypothetical protein